MPYEGVNRMFSVKLATAMVGFAVFGTLSGCSPTGDGSKVTEETANRISDDLQESMGKEMRPAIIRYLGIGDNDILSLDCNPVSPLTLKDAARVGMGREYVLPDRPQRLSNGTYDFLGTVRIHLKRSPTLELRAECYHDSQKGCWLLDRILERAPLNSEDSPRGATEFFLKPIAPAEGWDAEKVGNEISK